MTNENRATQPADEGRLESTVRPPTFPVRLVCWHCGESRYVLTHGPAQFAFEVVGWAQDAGMVGYFDMQHGRSLIFCDEGHARQQMTKDGQFRLRPKRAA